MISLPRKSKNPCKIRYKVYEKFLKTHFKSLNNLIKKLFEITDFRRVSAMLRTLTANMPLPMR